MKQKLKSEVTLAYIDIDIR